MTYRPSKLVALGALGVCVVGMVACRLFEGRHPWLGWPRAFFEAGTVGALADWFAVVALFRHPLGIPIPHTAVLPRNKARVADSLAAFLETSFLTEEQLGPRFRGIDYAGLAARWLETHARELAGHAVAFAPGVLGGLDDRAMAALLAARGRELLRAADLGPVAAEGLEILTAGGRDRAIFESVVGSIRSLLAEHRPMIQSKIREEIPISADTLAGIPMLGELAAPLLEQLRDALAAAVAAKTIEKVQGALDEAVREPGHALWKSFDERFRKFAADLRHSPELSSRLRALQEALAGGRLVDDFAARAWAELRDAILRDCSGPDSLIRDKLAEAIRLAASHLAASAATRDQVNAFLGGHVLEAALAAKPHARALIIETIHRWDAREMSRRLEAVVGADLQFIRLNGTIVGGLVGLGIHAAFQWAGGLNLGWGAGQ